MKKFLVPSLVIVLALLIAVPAFALEVKWGGLFRARVLSQVNFADYAYPANDLSMIRWSPGFDGKGNPVPGTTLVWIPATKKYENLAARADGAPVKAFEIDPKTGLPNYIPVPDTAKERSINTIKHLNRFDQRLRMFIDFISSENLKVVTKLEANTVWGAYGNPGARNIVGGGNVGADNNNLGIKNAYLEFKIPNTPITSKVGVQGIALVDSWIIDSDFSAALMEVNLKPFTIVLGYVSGQNFDTQHESENVDDLAAVVSYKEGPFSASIVGLWQDAHNTPASVFPTIGGLFDDPLQTNVLASPYAYADPWFNRLPVPLNGVQAQNNNLFDLGIQLGYKLDYLSAYLNFVKNFGSVKLGYGTADSSGTSNEGVGYFKANYTGWMIDAGANYFCGPWTLNMGGFYTSGQKVDMTNVNPTGPSFGLYPVPGRDNVDQFTYPLSTSKYFSEIIGGGILDNIAPNGGYWRGYPNPTNIWTLTAGAAWQALPQTKLSLSYWYFATSQKVPSRYHPTSGIWTMSNNLGSEVDLYITQNIVDKLNLDLVGAYMFTGNAYRAQTDGGNYPGTNNVYELGARLQWAW